MLKIESNWALFIFFADMTGSSERGSLCLNSYTQVSQLFSQQTQISSLPIQVHDYL